MTGAESRGAACCCHVRGARAAALVVAAHGTDAVAPPSRDRDVHERALLGAIGIGSDPRIRCLPALAGDVEDEQDAGVDRRRDHRFVDQGAPQRPYAGKTFDQSSAIEIRCQPRRAASFSARSSRPKWDCRS